MHKASPLTTSGETSLWYWIVATSTLYTPEFNRDHTDTEEHAYIDRKVFIFWWSTSLRLIFSNIVLRPPILFMIFSHVWSLCKDCVLSPKTTAKKKLLGYSITDSGRIRTPKHSASLAFGFYKCNRENRESRFSHRKEQICSGNKSCACTLVTYGWSEKSTHKFADTDIIKIGHKIRNDLVSECKVQWHSVKTVMNFIFLNKKVSA